MLEENKDNIIYQSNLYEIDKENFIVLPEHQNKDFLRGYKAGVLAVMDQLKYVIYLLILLSILMIILMFFKL